MALLLIEGWDKYGGVNSSTTSVAALMAGEWTTITNATIVAGLSATGQALQNSTTTSLVLAKTLATSYGRIIGGFRFSSTLAGNQGIQFVDNVTAQCGLQITASTGIISFRNGAWSTGTVIGSSSGSVSANTTHYLEWDITLGNAAAYNIYLDGVSIISGTGDTTATTNNTISTIQLVTLNSAVATFDDLYLFDTTGTTNNAVLLTTPRIETQLPSADSAVQFAVGASVLGPTLTRGGTINSAANLFYVRPFTPSRACTLNSISLTPNATSATINLRPVIYVDSANAPTTLLSAGSTVTGMTAATTVTMPLTTPQSLTAGTQYWLGFMADITGGSFYQAADATSNLGRTGTSTFASGAPSTAPATTAGQTTPMVWGNVTLAAPVNFYEVNQQPPASLNSYVFDATVGHEDLYNFPALSNPASVVYAVAVKGFVQKSDSGARTISFRTSSGGTDSGGSLTGQAPGTSFAWMGSFFPTDPATSAAWTVAALNLAISGIRNDS